LSQSCVKCIRKILANRLLLGLDAIISNNYAAFLPKRSILDLIRRKRFRVVCDYHTYMELDKRIFVKSQMLFASKNSTRVLVV